MDERDWLAERFEAHRDHLLAVAYRMLGSLSDADDAVQESWLRVTRADTSSVANLGGWLTTVVARVSLDMLRSRRSRRESSLDARVPDVMPAGDDVAVDPEQEALLADSVGLALLVVLETLAPAERLAFVLHDMFDVPYEEIAPVVGRSETAARQLASRARRRVRGAEPASAADVAQRRAVVDAFLTAGRAGDFQALLKVLDPDVVVAGDGRIVTSGAQRVAQAALLGAAREGRAAEFALVDGEPGIVVAPRGRLTRVLTFTVRDGRITRIDIVEDPERLRALHLAVLDV